MFGNFVKCAGRCLSRVALSKGQTNKMANIFVT